MEVEFKPLVSFSLIESGIESGTISEVDKKSEMVIKLQKYLSLFSISDKILLVGKMGAGKTYFTQQFLQLLGCEDLVTSPTFSLINEYSLADKSIKHLDLYRLAGKSGEISDELWTEIPLEEILKSDDLVLVEWGNLLPKCLSYFTKRIVFTLEVLQSGNIKRTLAIEGRVE